jgi:ABC-type sugar transport system substrate-binding protein
VITRELNFESVKAVTRGKRTGQPVLLDPAKKGWEDVLFEDFLESNKPPPPENVGGFSFTRIALLELD